MSINSCAHVAPNVLGIDWPLILSCGYTFQTPKPENVGSLGADSGAGQSLCKKIRILVQSFLAAPKWQWLCISQVVALLHIPFTTPRKNHPLSRNSNLVSSSKRMPTQRARKISENEWRTHHQTLKQLRLHEKKPLEGEDGIIAIMRRVHEFDAS